MGRATLPRLHPRTGAPLRPLGYRKDGRAIWPILGASEPPNQPPAPAPAPTPAPAPAPAPAPTPPPPAPNGNATDEQGNDLGFPASTPVAEMTDKQQAAYWRNQSKVQQAKVPKDADQLAEDARKWREHQQAQQTPAEQAVEAARAEGRAAALREANENAASAILRASLTSRGKDDAAVTALMKGFNPAGFTTDTGVDQAAIAAFVDSIAPAQQSGKQWDVGQGRGRGSTGGSSVAAGRDLHAERHAPRNKDASRS